jgi:hypothetical protein
MELTYPTNNQLQLIERDLLPQLQLVDPIFRAFPINNRDAHVISWEVRDNLSGMQQIRGLDGQPASVQAQGANRYTYEPGVYGEFAPVDETEITTRRPYGALAGTVSIDDLVAERHERLASRQITRIRYNIWTLLSTGVLSVLNGANTTLFKGKFPIKTYSASVTWATVATATPLADFRAMQLPTRQERRVRSGPGPSLI